MFISYKKNKQKNNVIVAQSFLDNHTCQNLIKNYFFVAITITHYLC